MNDRTKSLRFQLFVSFLTVIVLGMSASGLLAWRLVESLYLTTQQENLLAQAKLTAAALQGQNLTAESNEPYAQASNAMPGIHTRLLDQQGAMLVSVPLVGGEIQSPPVENTASISSAELLDRPEIASALQGLPAVATRRVASANGRRVLYAAAPVIALDGTVGGLVYLATPLPSGGLPPQWLASLVGAALAAILLATIVGIWMARRIAQPVETVARAARKVSRGDFTSHVPIGNGSHELRNLGAAFNQMTDSLRQAEQTQSAFVADVTHELRTPLTVIKGTLETLEDGAIDDAEGRGALLASMQHETERLIRLVNDLLVLARADSGTLNLHIQSLDLGELARMRCEHLATLASRKKVKLRVDVMNDSTPALVRGDADRLAQVLDNLLDNAIRYSPEGGTVLVAIQKEGSEYACAVRDSGPGISSEHLPMIFERFYRADASRNRQTGGAGLGLAIVRALLAAQGGRIRVDSAPGAGTTLCFFLPASID